MVSNNPRNPGLPSSPLPKPANSLKGPDTISTQETTQASDPGISASAENTLPASLPFSDPNAVLSYLPNLVFISGPGSTPEASAESPSGTDGSSIVTETSAPSPAPAPDTVEGAAKEQEGAPSLAPTERDFQSALERLKKYLKQVPNLTTLRPEFKSVVELLEKIEKGEVKLTDAEKEKFAKEVNKLLNVLTASNTAKKNMILIMIKGWIKTFKFAVDEYNRLAAEAQKRLESLQTRLSLLPSRSELQSEVREAQLTAGFFQDEIDRIQKKGTETKDLKERNQLQKELMEAQVKLAEALMKAVAAQERLLQRSQLEEQIAREKALIEFYKSMASINQSRVTIMEDLLAQLTEKPGSYFATITTDKIEGVLALNPLTNGSQITSFLGNYVTGPGFPKLLDEYAQAEREARDKLDQAFEAAKTDRREAQKILSDLNAALVQSLKPLILSPYAGADGLLPQPGGSVIVEILNENIVEKAKNILATLTLPITGASLISRLNDLNNQFESNSMSTLGQMMSEAAKKWLDTIDKNPSGYFIPGSSTDNRVVKDIMEGMLMLAGFSAAGAISAPATAIVGLLMLLEMVGGNVKDLEAILDMPRNELTVLDGDSPQEVERKNKEYLKRQNDALKAKMDEWMSLLAQLAAAKAAKKVAGKVAPGKIPDKPGDQKVQTEQAKLDLARLKEAKARQEYNDAKAAAEAGDAAAKAKLNQLLEALEELQVDVKVRELILEKIKLAQAEVDAALRKFLEEGGEANRKLWLDALDRLLKIQIVPNKPATPGPTQSIPVNPVEGKAYMKPPSSNPGAKNGTPAPNITAGPIKPPTAKINTNPGGAKQPPIKTPTTPEPPKPPTPEPTKPTGKSEPGKTNSTPEPTPLEKLEQEISKLEAEIQRLKEQKFDDPNLQETQQFVIQKLEAELAKLKAEQAKLKADPAKPPVTSDPVKPPTTQPTVKSPASKALDALEKIEQEMDALKERIEELKKKDPTEVIDGKTVKDLLSELKTQLGKLKGPRLNAIQEVIRVLSDEAKALRAELERKPDAARVKEINDRLAQIQTQLDTLYLDRIPSINETIRYYERVRRSLENRLKEDPDNADTQAKLEQNQKILDSLNKEKIDILRKAVEALQRQIDQLEAQLKNATEQAEIDRLQDEIFKLKRQRNSLRSEMNELEENANRNKNTPSPSPAPSETGVSAIGEPITFTANSDSLPNGGMSKQMILTEPTTFGQTSFNVENAFTFTPAPSPILFSSIDSLVTDLPNGGMSKQMILNSPTVGQAAVPVENATTPPPAPSEPPKAAEPVIESDLPNGGISKQMILDNPSTITPGALTEAVTDALNNGLLNPESYGSRLQNRQSDMP